MRTFPNLEYLDDKKLTDDLRDTAKQYDGSNINHTSIDSRNAHARVAQHIQTIWN